MIGFNLVTAVALLATTPSAIAAMRWEKRVLLVSASSARDPRLAEQRRVIGQWRAGAKDRDLALVEIVGEVVIGADDRAPDLRERYGLPGQGFAVVFIGKDGGIKLRRSRPVSSTALEHTIDAMPMRRDGRR
jgi:hypothetical protein